MPSFSLLLRSASTATADERDIPAALPWVHAAGLPYFDWLVGGRSAALRILDQWMRRPSSELFIGRVVLLDGHHPVGGFIGMPGSHLLACRLQDALAVASATPPERRAALALKLRCGRELFAQVDPEDFHLSRMGVVTEARRRGYGRAILREFIDAGASRGFRRFTLDVSADNSAAITLYRSAGFTPQCCRALYGGEMTYVRMVMVLRP